MHFGATLRLLRLESGLSLRDLARRLNVSGAYLSRVENGLDSAPTPARIRAIARELGVPEPLLLGLAHQVSPLIVDYCRENAEAAELFLEVAERRLDAAELGEVRAFLETRFPRRRQSNLPVLGGITGLLAPDRVVVGLSCQGIDDVFDVAAGRLAPALGCSSVLVRASLEERESEVTCAIGGGVALPCAHVDGPEAAAVVVTLAPALPYQTPDGAPLQAVIVLAGPKASSARRLALARVARWTKGGLAAQLAEASTPRAVLDCLARLEADG